MLYAILCYNDEADVCSWSKERDDAVMEALLQVQRPLAERGKLGPVARLEAGGAARTLRKDRQPFVVTDGPFAETKELVAGFWLWQVRSMEEAIEWAKRCPNPMPGEGSDLEIRPVFEMEDFGDAMPQELRDRENEILRGISTDKH